MDKFNKIKYSGLAKFIATIVLTCSMVSFVGMLLVSMIYAEIGGTSNILYQIKKKITYILKRRVSEHIAPDTLYTRIRGYMTLFSYLVIVN